MKSLRKPWNPSGNHEILKEIIKSLRKSSNPQWNPQGNHEILNETMKSLRKSSNPQENHEILKEIIKSLKKSWNPQGNHEILKEIIKCLRKPMKSNERWPIWWAIAPPSRFIYPGSIRDSYWIYPGFQPWVVSKSFREPSNPQGNH